MRLRSCVPCTWGLGLRAPITTPNISSPHPAPSIKITFSDIADLHFHICAHFIYHSLLCCFKKTRNSGVHLSRALSENAARVHDQRRGLSLMHLFFFGDPCFYGFFDSSGQVALFPAKSLDGLNPELLFQFI